MKKYILPFAVLALLLFACTPEDKNDESDGWQNYSEDIIITGDALEITECSATLTGYANLPLELGDAEVAIMYDKGQSFEDATKIVATELDGNNKFMVTATGLEASTAYYYKSYVKNGMAVKYGAVKSFTTKESTIPAGAVDLGMVLTREDGTTYKLYWAKSNLCESGLCANPEDCGDYYAWGETEPYYTDGHSQDNPCSSWRSRTDHPITGYNWESYKFWTSGDSYNNVTFSKYNTNDSYGPIDNITELQRGEGETVDDAARAKLGGKWRMPTDAEWTELRTQCSWSWTTQKGKNGKLVTAESGNSIFLPAVGYRIGTHLNGAESCGWYWSSSLNTAFSFNSLSVLFGDYDQVHRHGIDRYSGLSIRPVYEE